MSGNRYLIAFTVVSLTLFMGLYGCTEEQAQAAADDTAGGQASAEAATDNGQTTETEPDTASTGEEGSGDEFVRVDDRIILEASEFQYRPSHLEIPVATEVTLVLDNEGRLAHNLHIVKDGTTRHTQTIQTDAEDSVTVQFAETGTYRFHCEVAGHKAAGMTGVIRVVDQ